jgi:uncharacterized protein (DUF952 family)
MVYHITTRAAWQAALAAGEYRTTSLDEVGFIHLSDERQWPLTRARWFVGQRDLVLLVIDPTGLPITYEPADGDRFPHLYGPLALASVREVRELT